MTAITPCPFGRPIRWVPISLAFAMALSAGNASADAPATVPRIAVLHFELEDMSPAGVLQHVTTTSEAALNRVGIAAREVLAASGRYRVIDADPAPDAQSNTMSDCAECRIARDLGADEVLEGIVRRVSQTDYYLLVRIRDARTGKLMEEQAANFAGGEEGWASGVRLLIRHQVLIDADAAACHEAVVSPVSGYAECVDPRGAPVESAPARGD